MTENDVPAAPPAQATAGTRSCIAFPCGAERRCLAESSSGPAWLYLMADKDIRVAAD